MAYRGRVVKCKYCNGTGKVSDGTVSCVWWDWCSKGIRSRFRRNLGERKAVERLSDKITVAGAPRE